MQLASASAIAQSPRGNLGQAYLTAEQMSVPLDGGTVTLGVRIQPDAGWHLYWSNPGDAGLAPKVDWQLPAGFSVGDLAFPVPHVIPFGPLITYGYEGAVLLLADLSVPAGLPAGSSITIAGKVTWVACDNATCVPDKAEISLALVAANGSSHPRNSERFAHAREQLPADVAWPAQFSLDDGVVTIGIDMPREAAPASDLYLFPALRDLVKYDEQLVVSRPGGVTVTMSAHPKADRHTTLPGVLSYRDADGNEHAVSLTATRSSESLSTTNTINAAAPSANNPIEMEMLTLFTALMLAFAGGIVLNLMPCVFPILSMKALSLAKLSRQDAASRRESGLLYSAGILVAFAAIGLLLLALRGGEHAVGWGFQMQSPIFNVALGLLMLAIALNLFGIFEIGTRVTGLGQGLTEGSERRSAFFTGLLAVVVATPCTAPFMAGALGYALAQPPAVAMLIFLALGAGLAFPYLVLSFIPAAANMLPKPGPWMATLKQFLAFPMLATGIWLFWVVGKQTGVDSMSLALLAALCFAIALWAWGRSALAKRAGLWRLTAVAAAGPCILLLLTIADRSEIVRPADAISGEQLGAIQLEAFTPDRVANHIVAERPVFVFFTADWCITCKMNERVALATDAVASAFEARGIKAIKGDWTSQDAVITEWLERYDRAGVPLYLYFPVGSTLSTATILPQVLTPAVVISAIDRADARYQVPSTNASEAVSTAGKAPPLWSVVQSYIDSDNAWHRISDEINSADTPDEESQRRIAEELGPHPSDNNAALDSAVAIARSDSYHPKSFEAAEFLLRNTRGTNRQIAAPEISAAVQLLSERLRNHERLPELLYWLDLKTEVGQHDDVERLFEQTAASADSAVYRGIGSYYAAARRVRRMNVPGVDADILTKDRHEATTFLAQIESDTLKEKVWRYRSSSEQLYLFPMPTLGLLRDELQFVMQHSSSDRDATNVVVAGLDGSQKSVEEYRGQVVLLDFWATWCGSCLVSLPELRELRAQHSGRPFEIVSLSIDDEPQIVLDFMTENPMGWVNWFIGPDSDLWNEWGVSGTPTYVLLDAEGVVRGRSRELDETFRQQIIALLPEQSAP